MEQLIFALLVVVASIVSSVIQNKKKREAEEEEWKRTGQPPVSKPPAPASNPLERWPQSPGEWQDTLRRILHPEEAAHKPPPPPLPLPPVAPQRTSSRQTKPRPEPPPPIFEASEGDVVYASPFHQSTAGQQRAAQLDNRVEERFRQLDRQRVRHRPTQPAVRLKNRMAVHIVKRWKTDPVSLREAVIASIILGPPQSLKDAD